MGAIKTMKEVESALPQKKEINYVSTKLHQYTAKVIELCRKFRAGTIELVAPEKEQLDNLLLRNWSYYGLTDKLQYKCRIAGIELKKNGELKETISTGVSAIIVPDSMRLYGISASSRCAASVRRAFGFFKK